MAPLRSHGLVLALALVLAPGCAVLRRRPVRPFVPATAADVLASLEARRAGIGSLRARARLKAGLTSLWTRQVILVQRPEGVRIDVLVPYGVALAIGVDGDRLWAFPPSAGVRFEGRAGPATFGRLLGAPVETRDLVDILLGVPPSRVGTAPVELATTADGEYRLSIPHAEGTEIVWLTGDGLVPIRVEEHRDGVMLLRVTFGDHQDGFPHTLSVAAPVAGTEAQVVFDHVQPNAAIDPALFAPPAAAEVRPLEAIPG